MNVKTIKLTGSEVAVKVGGGNSEIKNNGVDTIYASASSGVVAGADGVVSIPAGASVTVTDTLGTVYILGTGSVEVVGKDFVAPVFKAAAAAGGNPNLLINPDFAVNQRGQSSWAGAEYMVDRWYKRASDTTIYLNADGSLHVPAKTIFLQRMPIDDYQKLIGKTLTFTVKYSGEVPVWVSFAAPAPKADISYRIHPDADRFWITTYENMGFVELRYYDPTADHDIEWAKLEIGGVSTPYCPPDPTLELLKCQRYYQIRSTGDIAAVDLRPSMATIKDIKQRSDGLYEYIAEL